MYHSVNEKSRAPNMLVLNAIESFEYTTNEVFQGRKEKKCTNYV